MKFFSLRDVPFSISPDPEFLFLSRTHRSVLDSLCHGITTRSGFLLLTGEIGTGKTMVCRLLLKKMAGSANLVYIINPSLTGTELIGAILDDLEISYPENATKKRLLGALNSFLLEQPDDTPVVILIDDAQTMSVESLEDIRLLSNLETNKKKLLQIVLVGQPELLETISTKSLRQLQQRITIHTRLHVLTLQETRLYILRRLFVAGDHGAVRFTTGAVRLVHQEAGGLPRAINKICDYALMAGFVDDAEIITRRHVKKACRELRHLLRPDGVKKAQATISRNAVVAVLVLLLLSAGIGVWLWSDRPWPPSMRQSALSLGTTLPAPVRPDVRPHATAATSGQSNAPPLRTEIPPPARNIGPEAAQSGASDPATSSQPGSVVAAPPVQTVTTSPMAVVATSPPAAPQPDEAFPAQPDPAPQRTEATPPARDAGPEAKQTVTTVPATDAGSETGQDPVPAYTIQLASFAKRQDAMQEIKRYAAMGITAHLQEKGKWYRLLTGVFAQGREAQEAITQLNLTDAVIHFTPDARFASPDDFADPQKRE